MPRCQAPGLRTLLLHESGWTCLFQSLAICLGRLDTTSGAREMGIWGWARLCGFMLGLDTIVLVLDGTGLECASQEQQQDLSKARKPWSEQMQNKWGAGVYEGNAHRREISERWSSFAWGAERRVREVWGYKHSMQNQVSTFRIGKEPGTILLVYCCVACRELISLYFNLPSYKI